MYNKIFIPYWKFVTFFYKPIKPYYNWMWRQPGKKAIFLLVVSSISIVWQFKMLEKWQNKLDRANHEAKVKAEVDASMAHVMKEQNNN